MFRVGILLLGLAALSVSGSTSLAAAEAVLLTDGGASQATLARIVTVTGGGTFSFQSPKPEKEKLPLPVNVEATYQFLARRIPGTGSEAAAFRAYRKYHKVNSRIEVGKQTAERTLRQRRRRIVASLSPKGIQVYSPNGPLTAREIEVLPTPGDPLMLAALLPDDSVAVGETWTPPEWTASMLAGVDIAFEREISCELAGVEAEIAHITFTSSVDGAVKGTEVTTTVSGGFDFNIKSKRITAATITHTEQRQIGPLSPGMEIELTSHLVTRSVSETYAIADEVVTAVGNEAPTPADLAIAYSLAGGISLVCDRKWQLFHRSDERLILRLLDQGSLIAQGNVMRADTLAAGTHTSGRAFQKGIRQSLGDDLEKIVSAEELTGLAEMRVYRVTAVGGGQSRPRQWRYYLVTAGDGRQVSFVFTVEPENVAAFGNQDVTLIQGLTFREQATDDG